MKKKETKEFPLRKFLQTELRKLATRDELKNLATKDELKNLATKNDLKNLATRGDLLGLATKEDLKLVQADLENSIEKVAAMTQREFKVAHDRLDRIENVLLRQHEVKIDDLQKRLKLVEDTFALNHKKS